MGRSRGTTGPGRTTGRARGSGGARAPATSAGPPPDVLRPSGAAPEPPGSAGSPAGPEPPDDYAAGAEDLFRALVRTRDGERVGRVSAVLLGTDAAPRWLVVSTGLVRAADVPVPVAGSSLQGAAVVVPWSREVVRSAPRWDPDRPADPQLEVGARLHYAAALAARARGGSVVPAPPVADDDEAWWDAEVGRPGAPGGPAQPPRTAS